MRVVHEESEVQITYQTISIGGCFVASGQSVPFYSGFSALGEVMRGDMIWLALGVGGLAKLEIPRIYSWSRCRFWNRALIEDSKVLHEAVRLCPLCSRTPLTRLVARCNRKQVSCSLALHASTSNEIYDSSGQKASCSS